MIARKSFNFPNFPSSNLFLRYENKVNSTDSSAAGAAYGGGWV
jgi:hypothetical protein